MKSSPKYPDLSPAPELFAKLLYNAIHTHGLANRVIVQSFDFRTLHAMKTLDPALRLSALYEGSPRVSWPSLKRPGRRSSRRTTGW